MTAGQVIQRYLRALAEPRPPVNWRAAPATYKRYPAEGRVVLPWTSAPGHDQSLAAFGAFMRDLLGLRTRWTHPTSDAGLPTGAAPQLAVARPAPSGGGLYPIEAYLAIGPGPNQPAGLYHYDAAHHCLDLIRPGDHRAALTEQLVSVPATSPDLVLVLTAVFWRNGFKYGEFAYRLQCQETGALTAQALALADTLNLTPTAHLRFADDAVQALLGPDPTREGPLAILTFTGPATEPGPTAAELLAAPARIETNPAPSVADRLPHLFALHTAAAEPDPPPRHEATANLPQNHQSRENHEIRLAEGVRQRKSAPSGYRPLPLDQHALTTILASAADGHPSDVTGQPRCCHPHVLIQRVSGVAPGVYRYEADELVRVADANAVAAVARGPLHPNTRQALPEAAAALIPVGDPLAGVGAHGERWYRIQQIETGLMVHRAALAATTLGLAARIHSDATNTATDAALGLASTPLRGLSCLLLGHHRAGHTLL